MTALEWLGRIGWMRGQADEALDHLRRCEARAEPRDTVWARLFRGEVYESLGRVEDAEPLLRSVADAPDGEADVAARAESRCTSGRSPGRRDASTRPVPGWTGRGPRTRASAVAASWRT